MRPAEGGRGWIGVDRGGPGWIGVDHGGVSLRQFEFEFTANRFTENKKPLREQETENKKPCAGVVAAYVHENDKIRV